MAKINKHPGVFIEEQSSLSNSIVPVETAIPAFVGYTEKAMDGKKSLRNSPMRITSLVDYERYFGDAPKTLYRIEETGNGQYELQLTRKRFFLYYSIKWFFTNGGDDCYIVSVGDYRHEIQLADYDNFIPLEKQPEPTMLVVPDAISLEQKECYSLQQSMLMHCGDKMQNRIAILDIHDGFKARNPGQSDDLIDNFRTGIGSNFLSFGAAYYPWLHTTVVQSNDLDFSFFDKKSRERLVGILESELKKELEAGQARIVHAVGRRKEIRQLEKASLSRKKIIEAHRNLLATSMQYKAMMNQLREQLNLLPPSGAMAGIYAMMDHTRGVFQAPANVSIPSVVKPAVDISHSDQEELNVPLNGKAINAIRTFPGQGILVWGARTLDGNSQDWRYISVRRTLIFLEQSIKNALEAYVFEPNDANTWVTVRSMISNFLTNFWRQGGLAGATPEDAFSVGVGLGETMTAVDILDGMMKVSVLIAVTRPAEFIVFTLEQKMQSA